MLRILNRSDPFHIPRSMQEIYLCKWNGSDSSILHTLDLKISLRPPKWYAYMCEEQHT